MKLLRNIPLLLIVFGLVFASACKKKELERMEEENDRLKQDSTELADDLNHHHCIYGVAVPGHDDEETAEFVSATFNVWKNTESEPGNTGSGYDITVEGSVREGSTEAKLFVDGLPVGVHWVHAEISAKDTTGADTHLEGGQAIEIEDGEHCASAHIHAGGH